MAYQRRLVDDTLDRLLPGLAAIALDGAKGVGKTATGTQRAATVLDFSRPARRQAVSIDEDFIRKVPAPVLLDEWQLVPQVWDQVKRAVDDDWTGGRFLLAGSAAPPSGAQIHSGAGRIVSLTMRPLSFVERAIVPPTVSLASLLDGSRGMVEGMSPVTVPDYVEEILASGLPGIRRLPDARLREEQLDSYLARIVERDLPDNGVSVRRPAALRAWLAAYAAATAGTAQFSVIARAANAGSTRWCLGVVPRRFSGLNDGIQAGRGSRMNSLLRCSR
jgi:predicted AAA+ superfamily ATPase